MRFNRLIEPAILSLLLIFSSMLCLFGQVDEINKLSNFSHYRDSVYEVLKFRIVSVGMLQRHMNFANPSKVETTPVNIVKPQIGFRYSAEPQNIYFLSPSMWRHLPHVESLVKNNTSNAITGYDKFKKPIYTADYLIGVNLIKHSDLQNLGIRSTQVSHTISASGWKIPPISSPDQVQILVYLNERDAAQGKNIVTTTVGFPLPGDEDKITVPGAGSDLALPAGIVFAIMFLALGLSGSATSPTPPSPDKSEVSDRASEETPDTGTDTTDEIENEPTSAKPSIVLNRPALVMIEGTSSHPEVTARIINSSEAWSFNVDAISGLENAVAGCSCSGISAASCRISIQAAQLPEGAGRLITSLISIKALNQKTGEKLETKMNLTSARQGLILVSHCPVRIAADGESESEIEITALATHDGKISTDFDLLQQLSFESQIETTSEKSKKAFSTATPLFRSTGTDCGWRNLRGFEKNEPATFVFKVKTARLLPGQGESYFATAWLRDSSGKNRLAVPLMLDVDLMQVESRGWQIELERCRRIIGKLPVQHQKRLFEFLDSRAAFLGAKGLYELRLKIWKAGQALWEAEGLSGYESVERWAFFIETTLKFAQWTGRLATDFLIANKLKLGVFKAMAVGELYDILVTSIQAYQQEKTFEQWLEQCLWAEVRDMIIEMGAAGLDPDMFVARFSNDKKILALAWSVQFVYHFIANLTLHKLPLIEAAKKAALSVTSAAALKFLLKKSGELAEKKGYKNLTNTGNDLDDAAIQGVENAGAKLDGFEKAIKSGDKKAIRDLMLDIQSDKFALKLINKKSNELKIAYNNEMARFYASIDQRVKKKIIQDLKSQGINISSKDLRMTNASNSTNRVKVGSDRDVAVEYTFLDKNGKLKTVEYPKENLKDAYGREFYRSVGHKKAENMAPDELLDKYDQYMIDSGDAEAYGIKRLNYEKGKAENLDFDRVMNKSGLPEKLDDGGQIGMTVSYKAKHWFNKASDTIKASNPVEGESFKLEGMSQLVKQYKNIYKPRHDLLNMMGKRQADDSKISSLINFMEKAVNLEKSPSYVENLVKKSGFYSLNDFADSFGDKIASMNSMMD
ncbi:MAG: hypothetical protein AB1403_01090 [Candidatus Riflebacteria bacterium]